jgi:anti-sigma factor RsiW
MPRFVECEALFAALSEYLDAELSSGECEGMRAHLASCPECIRFLDSLRRTVELCRRQPPAAMPPPLSESARRELWEAFQRSRCAGGAP